MTRSRPKKSGCRTAKRRSSSNPRCAVSCALPALHPVRLPAPIKTTWGRRPCWELSDTSSIPGTRPPTTGLKKSTARTASGAANPCGGVRMSAPRGFRSPSAWLRLNACWKKRRKRAAESWMLVVAERRSLVSGDTGFSILDTWCRMRVLKEA